MRELTVRIEFTSPSLGHVKCKDNTRLSGRFVMLRCPRDGHVLFLPTWWQSNMRFAAQVLGRHQSDIQQIHWDSQVDGIPKRRKLGGGRYEPVWFSRHYGNNSRKRRYSLHEAFHAGQFVGINCVVPSSIDDDGFRRLMELIGRYRGISAFRPGEFGMFQVAAIQPRKAPQEPETKKTEALGGSVPRPHV